MVPYFLDSHENIRFSIFFMKITIVFIDQPNKRVTFVGYSWNSQEIFLYSVFPRHYCGIFPVISLGIFFEYTGNISRACSMNISQTYIFPVGNGLVRKVTIFVKSSIFEVWHGFIPLQFLKNLKLNRLISIEYQHKSNSVTESYALSINMDHKHGLYSIFHAWTIK